MAEGEFYHTNCLHKADYTCLILAHEPPVMNVGSVVGLNSLPPLPLLVTSWFYCTNMLWRHGSEHYFNSRNRDTVPLACRSVTLFGAGNKFRLKFCIKHFQLFVTNINLFSILTVGKNY